MTLSNAAKLITALVALTHLVDWIRSSIRRRRESPLPQLILEDLVDQLVQIEQLEQLGADQDQDEPARECRPTAS